MKKILTSLLCAGMVFGGGSARAADLLKSLEDKKRPLLLFAKSRSFAGLDQQVDLLRGYRPDLLERDVVVLSTTGRQETQSVIGYTPVDRGTARKLRKRFEPSSSGLTVVLIGKDGMEKARWDQVVEPLEIFDIIDAMPMRKQEMKEAAEAG